MTWGLPKGTGFGTIHVVEFKLEGTGADTLANTGIGETALAVENGQSDASTRWQAPWPCVVSEVFVGGELLAANDAARIRLTRSTVVQAATSGTDLIKNAVSGSAVDYINLAAATANTEKTVRYYNALQDTNVAPGIYAATASDDATIFDDDQNQFAAGDYLQATVAMAIAADSVSQFTCKVTLAKIG